MSDTVFNLNRIVLTDTEIKDLEKGLDFAPIQRKLNENELRRDLKDFCHRMRLKLHFRDKRTPRFSEQPFFSPKLSWSPPAGLPNLEEFKFNISCFGFLIKSLSIPTLPRMSNKPLDLLLMIDLSLKRRLIKHVV